MEGLDMNSAYLIVMYLIGLILGYAIGLNSSGGPDGLICGDRVEHERLRWAGNLNII